MLQRPFPAMFVALGLLQAPVLEAQVHQSRQRDLHEWEVKADKMRRHLIPAMRKHGVDMWIIMSHENHPDPMLDLFGGYGISGWYGHRNAYILYDRGGDEPLETFLIGTHQSDHMKRFFQTIVSYGEEGLATHLKKLVDERDPETIAINSSPTISAADGLSVELKKYLVDAIGPKYSERFVSSEPLAIDYVSHRTPEELEILRQASWATYNLLRRAFSNEVITPGKTTLMDVYWWIVDEWKAQDLEFNFPPGLDIQRQGHERAIEDSEDPIIEPGDVLHVDFGVRLMGLVTDQQKMAYVLRPGETEAPAGLQKAFAQSVRMAEIICDALEPGAIGHEIKSACEKRGKEEGIDNSTYPHAQGNWVHGIGSWVSFNWPERYGRHPEEPVRPNEIWSIEFSTFLEIPEWEGQRVRMAREEDAWVDADGDVRYFAGPQMDLWLIESEASEDPRQ